MAASRPNVTQTAHEPDGLHAKPVYRPNISGPWLKPSHDLTPAVAHKSVIGSNPVNL